MKTVEVAADSFLLAPFVDAGWGERGGRGKLCLPSAVATWSDYRRSRLSAGHWYQANPKPSQGCPTLWLFLWQLQNDSLQGTGFLAFPQGGGS